MLNWVKNLFKKKEEIVEELVEEEVVEAIQEQIWNAHIPDFKPSDYA